MARENLRAKERIMNNPWAQMTDAEKIEILRNNLIRLGELVNMILSKHDVLAQTHQVLANLAQETAKEVEKLKDQ
jgi:hypothetical protein